MNLPSTDPTLLIQMRDSVYAIDLMITAIGRLNFFTWLYTYPGNLKSICDHFKLDPRPADVMMTLFKAYGLVMEKNDIFITSKMTEEHLIDNSPFSLVAYYAIQADRPIVDKMYDVLTTGVSASWSGKLDEAEWVIAMEKTDFAKKFTDGMNSRGAYVAPHFAKSFGFSKYSSLLDVAGGSGIYAATVAELHKHLKVAVFERSPVDRIAKKSLSQWNSGSKISVIPVDMFKDSLPKGYDIHLFSHVLHDWNIEQNRIIVKNSFESLNPGGSIMILDSHLNVEKNGPIPVAEYSVLLMFSTPGKCYSVGEIEQLLLTTGFKEMKIIPLVANRSLVVGIK